MFSASSAGTIFDWLAIFGFCFSRYQCVSFDIDCGIVYGTFDFHMAHQKSDSFGNAGLVGICGQVCDGGFIRVI